MAAVALGLAAIAALTGQIGRARELLRLAAQHGLPVASTYAAALLDRDSPDRTEALHTLGQRPDDTDALNFLGIAARADGDLEKAWALWDTSVVGGDAVAPLLIKIAFPGEEQRSLRANRTRPGQVSPRPLAVSTRSCVVQVKKWPTA